MQNALTVDLEEYFHVSAYAKNIRPQDWSSFPSRVSESTDQILALLDHHSRKATFFVLGWVAETSPEVVRRVATAGHEIACHSHLHRRVFELTPDQFREDTRRAKSLIEEVSGKRVLGYRAPSFSINSKSMWALEILVEAGFQYDSSIFPVKHPSYGVPEAPRSPFGIRTPSGTILEYPMTVLEFSGRRAPLAGGAYLRALPYFYTRWAIGYLNAFEHRSACVYLHPWELDADQPLMKGSLTSRLRHRLGLRGTKRKLGKLLGDFEFCPLGALVEEGAGSPSARVISVGDLQELSTSS